MLDFFIPIEMYERVMGNDKVTNKFLGYFWRVALFYAILFVVALALLALFSWQNIGSIFNLYTMSLYGLVALLVCTIAPVVSYKLVSRKSKKEQKPQ